MFTFRRNDGNVRYRVSDVKISSGYTVIFLKDTRFITLGILVFFSSTDYIQAVSAQI